MTKFTVIQADGLYSVRSTLNESTTSKASRTRTLTECPPKQDDTVERELFAKSVHHDHEVEYLQLNLWPAGQASPEPWSSIPKDLRERVNGIMLLKLRMTEEDVKLFPRLEV